MAIATSSGTVHAVEKLRQAGVLLRFKTVIGADQVQRPKPDPEVYLKAAGHLGVDPGPVWRSRTPSTACARLTPPA